MVKNLSLTAVSIYLRLSNYYICRFSERHDAPRTNFDNFLKAMLAVFQVRASIFQPPFPHNLLSISEIVHNALCFNSSGLDIGRETFPEICSIYPPRCCVEKDGVA